MNKYKIADIIVDMEPKTDPYRSQSVPYLYSGEENPIFAISVPDEYIRNTKEKYPVLSNENIEYLLSGNMFYTVLISFKGMMIHASAVMLDDAAYLFSAPSGTGKSTHTSLWLKEFKNAKILNDDKPALRIYDDEVYVYGTPWSGKTDQNINTKVKLKGICFLERGEHNSIKKADVDTAIARMLEQTVRPPFQEGMNALLDNIEKIIETVPIYSMKCNMDPEAAHLSYNIMSGKVKI